MKRSLPVLGVLLLLAIVTSWLRSQAYPRSNTPLTHQAYVWQRQWTPAVRDAVAGLDPKLSPPVLLVAELAWPSSMSGMPPELDEFAIDEKAIAGKPYAVAVRLGGGDPAHLRLNSVPAMIAAHLGKLHYRPVELHVDFDCPESKLRGYRELAAEIRKAVAPLPVAITALPSWLDADAFADLAADGPYILQVHSLSRPKTFDADSRIIDVAAARRAVAKAARIGAPFRVALPTYGHAIAELKNMPGQCSVLSENLAGLDPARFNIKWVRTDPGEIASLVAEWTASHPVAMTGILWYRLPVAGDQLNWRLVTLAAVMAGRAPAANVGVAVTQSGGLAELSLVNTGDADAALPARLTIDWTGPPPVASDFVGGYSTLDQTPTSVTLSRSESPPGDPANRIAPGDRRAIGWLRFTQDTEVRGHVTPP